MLNLILFLYLSPLILAYLAICFTVSFVRVGEEMPGKGVKFYIAKDLIHSDYLFESQMWEEMFEPKGRYIKIGWGDRRIFLETKTWADLNATGFLTAFFGLNKTVLRVEFLENVPNNSKPMEIDEMQLAVIKEHVKSSFKGKPIEKKPTHCQTGCYYESDLKYNCFTNCNNWVNYGLYLGRATNRIWCPFSFWV
jgi:hypothetical protein